MQPSTRVHSLDGLRGIASCAVVGFHFFYAFVPRLIPPGSGTAPLGIYDLPAGWLWNGRFAVVVFFALSGWVLAASSTRRAVDVPRVLALRYLRIGVPATASCVLAWIWLTAYPDAAGQAQALSGSGWFKWTYQAPIPSLLMALYEGGIQTFVVGTTRFNSPLWTMQPELFGSFLIYGLYGLVPARARVPVLTAGAIVLGPVTAEWYLCAFLLGALTFEFRDRLMLPPRGAWILFFVSLALGGAYPGIAARIGLGFLPYHEILGTSEGPVTAFAACGLMLAVIRQPLVRAAFERPLARKLGELSFPLYLTHVPIICTLGSHLYVAWAPASAWSLIGLFLVTASVSLATAVLLLVAVERPLLALLRRLKPRR